MTQTSNLFEARKSSLEHVKATSLLRRNRVKTSTGDIIKWLVFYAKAHGAAMRMGKSLIDINDEFVKKMLFIRKMSCGPAGYSQFLIKHGFHSMLKRKRHYLMGLSQTPPLHMTLREMMFVNQIYALCVKRDEGEVCEDISHREIGLLMLERSKQIKDGKI